MRQTYGRTSRKNLLIQIFNLVTYSIEQSEIAFSRNDDKRYILPDDINTLAIGHYQLYTEQFFLKSSGALPREITDTLK